MIHKNSHRVKILLQKATEVSLNSLFELFPVWSALLLFCDADDHLNETELKQNQ